MQAFTSDVGEAARPVVHPRIVTASYGISWMYCIADVAVNAMQANSRGSSRHETFEIIAEKSVFHTFASMALPAATIHTTVRLSRPIFMKLGRFTRFGPSMAGLAVVPLLPFIWDKPVEKAIKWAFTEGRKVAGFRSNPIDQNPPASAH